MTRTIASIAALALVGTTATASAATQTYRGEIMGDDKALVQLKVEVGGKRRILTEFTVRKFPLECQEGTNARLQSAELAGRATISRKGRFRLEASNADQQLGIRGRLKRGNMKGRVNYSGLTEFADGMRECQAERLRWTATRQGGPRGPA